jgi:DNA-binding CsgD family transcriptional regulator
MTLNRLALGAAHPERALAFVRHSAASWRGFRVLERSVLEGALALTRERRGQTVFVGLNALRSFEDRRIETIEAKAIDPNQPYGLMRELLRTALTRPDARSALAVLPADLMTYLKFPILNPQADRSTWPAVIAEFLEALTVRAPLMIVLDHAHRADAESLAALEALARRAASSRILLIVTYRVDAVPTPALDSIARALIDARLARLMVIAPPYADEGRLLFEAAFGRSARPESAAASIADDDAALLMHGLTVVAECRRVGRWADAKAAAERLIAAGEAHTLPYAACAAAIAIGHVLADQGKWDESVERLEKIQAAVEVMKEDTLIAWLYLGLARARWGQSDRRRGFQMLRLARTVSAHIPDVALKAAIEVCGVEWLADNRRVRAARDWLDALEQIASQSDDPRVDAALAVASGVVALAEQGTIAATGFFRAALRKHHLLGNEYAVAQAHLRLSAALLQRDNAESRSEGREELVDAHAMFMRLGAAAGINATEELGAVHGVRPRARRAPSNGSTSPGGITPREREVLGLLVRGMTNRQIAATLSITEKTAEGHVSNILAKLGVASRVQAAGYAQANGLLEPAET